MLALISFILVIVGAINWFCIGLLQFDFVAGLFGSQSSIFSRIVYIAVGLAALILLFNLIENKGKIKFNFKKKQENKERYYENAYYDHPRYSNSVEAGKDVDKDNDDAFISFEKDKENDCSTGSCKIDNDDQQNENDDQQNDDNENEK